MLSQRRSVLLSFGGQAMSSLLQHTSKQEIHPELS